MKNIPFDYHSNDWFIRRSLLYFLISLGFTVSVIRTPESQVGSFLFRFAAFHWATASLDSFVPTSIASMANQRPEEPFTEKSHGGKRAKLSTAWMNSFIGFRWFPNFFFFFCFLFRFSVQDAIQLGDQSVAKYKQVAYVHQWNRLAGDRLLTNQRSLCAIPWKSVA